MNRPLLIADECVVVHVIGIRHSIHRILELDIEVEIQPERHFFHVPRDQDNRQEDANDDDGDWNTYRVKYQNIRCYDDEDDGDYDDATQHGSCKEIKCEMMITVVMMLTTPIMEPA